MCVCNVAERQGAAERPEFNSRFEAFGYYVCGPSLIPLTLAVTAMVQGYMLVHGGPVTDKELQDALGLSHRAIRLALEGCVEWGIVRRAPEPRRSGRRDDAQAARRARRDEASHGVSADTGEAEARFPPA